MALKSVLIVLGLQLRVLLQLGMGDDFAWPLLHGLLPQGLPTTTPQKEAWRWGPTRPTAIDR